ncbi:glycoside hydrolase family 3 N-terminal domain-containing protein [Glaciecola sp. SC05]|uniref:glycoside hydrolase family 3 N-terminal domain-containing protein n=1 Tax=Glaciecola sp. SC05 TaxID=1987355 RepID=UPI0035295D61
MLSFFKRAQSKLVVTVLCSVGLFAISAGSALSSDQFQPTLRQMLAQKLLIDLRYYCEDLVQPSQGQFCQSAMTQLPDHLANMLTNTEVGGVILFSENLQNAEQILALTHAIQETVNKNSDTGVRMKLPMYIAVDQEGGRVSRLPNDEFLGFSGNMAIGATFQRHGVFYAEQVAQNMAKSLYALGFNVNFAPSVDVNSDPDNPIINVRAFSQSQQTVAILGAAQIVTFQANNIAAAAKHFPGHGDTHVDSHVGLPRVEHSKATIDAVDIFPFKYAIENADVDMIMTAHIQYPVLDSTTFSSTDGRITELPATLSRKILTGLLREELKFQGLIVTDALDMAAITQFLSPVEATVKAFEAGADIALMPFRISSKYEAEAFEKFLDEVTAAVKKNSTLAQAVATSYARIVAHKRKRNMHLQANKSLQQKQIELDTLRLSNKQHMLANALGKDAFTEIKALSASIKPSQSVYAVMPDKRRCSALQHFLKQAGLQDVSCVSQLSEAIDTASNADVLIVGDVSPALSFFESRAFEGIQANQRKDAMAQIADLKALVANSQAQAKILLKLRSPYVTQNDMLDFDAVYASYDYQVSSFDGNLFSPALFAFAVHITGQHEAKGIAPVDILQPK